MGAPSVDELSSALTVPMLKQRLRDAGLPVSGRKAELVERLSSVGRLLKPLWICQVLFFILQ